MKPVERPLQDKVAIVTGASRGLGLAIAEKYVMAGANLTICARNALALEAAAAGLKHLTRPDQEILFVITDVSRAEDAGACVDSTLKKFGRIDILVNNAGVYGPKGVFEELDWEAWVQALQINLMGSILMCRAVLPHLKAQGSGKIVQLSGGGATNPLPRLSAYAVSKAAIVRFIETLAEEVKEWHIDVNCIAPGALNTSMLEEVLADGPERVGQVFYERALRQKEEGGVPLDRGAELAVFLGSSLSDGITGKLISAVWDPWLSLPQHLDELIGSDIYTLRRIVPGDRGKTWGSRK